MNYDFEYAGEKYSIPKGKIFETLQAMGKVKPIIGINSIFQNTDDFLEVAAVFAVLVKYAGKEIDCMEISKDYLYETGRGVEIYKAVNGIIELLSPPDNYQPPVEPAKKKPKQRKAAK